MATCALITSTDLAPVELMFKVHAVLEVLNVFEKFILQIAPATNAKLTPLVIRRYMRQTKHLRNDMLS